jgi:hypothetical protein
VVAAVWVPVSKVAASKVAIDHMAWALVKKAAASKAALAVSSKAAVSKVAPAVVNKISKVAAGAPKSESSLRIACSTFKLQARLLVMNSLNTERAEQELSLR